MGIIFDFHPPLAKVGLLAFLNTTKLNVATTHKMIFSINVKSVIDSSKQQHNSRSIIRRDCIVKLPKAL